MLPERSGVSCRTRPTKPRISIALSLPQGVARVWTSTRAEDRQHASLLVCSHPRCIERLSALGESAPMSGARRSNMRASRRVRCQRSARTRRNRLAPLAVIKGAPRQREGCRNLSPSKPG